MQNQLKIEIGDILELSDLVGEKYKQTHQYDLNIENPLEIFKYDENDFKFIELLPSQKTNTDKLERPIIVYKLLSGFRDYVKQIRVSSNKLIGITNFLKIDVNRAIDNCEIKILKKADEVLQQKIEIDLIEEIRERYELYSLGLITVKELNRSLEDKNCTYFQLQTKWKTNFSQSITGKFYKNNNS